jgi:hypothetical protein
MQIPSESGDFYCFCGSKAVICVTAGCINMHINGYAYCKGHLSPVTVPICPCGKTYMELLVKYLLTGQNYPMTVPSVPGNHSITFPVAILP